MIIFLIYHKKFWKGQQKHNVLEFHQEKHILYEIPTLYNFLVSSCFIKI